MSEMQKRKPIEKGRKKPASAEKKIAENRQDESRKRSGFATR